MPEYCQMFYNYLLYYTCKVSEKILEEYDNVTERMIR